MDKGIDYGMGTTNIDLKTGIRYGVISTNAPDPWLWEELEPVYGSPVCWSSEMELDEDWNDGDACPHCGAETNDRVYPDSPLGWVYSKNGYECHVGADDSDLWVTKSPYVTRAQFCSPCAPGACHLEHPCPDGERAYCLGPEWFDDESPCPYVPEKLES